jgi:hypothetical protein
VTIANPLRGREKRITAPVGWLGGVEGGLAADYCPITKVTTQTLYIRFRNFVISKLGNYGTELSPRRHGAHREAQVERKKRALISAS